MAVHRYKTAHFEGNFLGARAVLDIFFEFALVIQSGRKNEGAILHLLMQFKDLLICFSISWSLIFMISYHWLLWLEIICEVLLPPPCAVLWLGVCPPLCVSWPVVGLLYLRKFSVVCVGLRACTGATFVFVSQKGWEPFICLLLFALLFQSLNIVSVSTIMGSNVFNPSLYLVLIILILELFVTDLVICYSLIVLWC